MIGTCCVVAAIGIDEAGDKHVLAVALGATENAAVVKALLADLVERGLRPDIARLFIVDGAKALSRAVRYRRGQCQRKNTDCDKDAIHAHILQCPGWPEKRPILPERRPHWAPLSMGARAHQRAPRG